MTYASVCHSFLQISLLLVQYMTNKNRDLVQKYDIKNHDLVQNTCVYQLFLTSNTQELVSYALAAFRRGFRPNTQYKKAGVVLLKIIPETAVVPDMFDTKDRAKDNRLQRVLDHINDRHGKRAILLGSQLTSQQPVYKTDHQSPLYTTDLRDIITLKAT